MNTQPGAWTPPPASRSACPIDGVVVGLFVVVGYALVVMGGAIATAVTDEALAQRNIVVAIGALVFADGIGVVALGLRRRRAWSGFAGIAVLSLLVVALVGFGTQPFWDPDNFGHGAMYVILGSGVLVALPIVGLIALVRHPISRCLCRSGASRSGTG